MQAVEQLLQRLHNELGFEAERIGFATVSRALKGRMEALNLQDAAYYPTLAWQQPEEWRAFIDAVVVPESWFMRGPESFAWVQRLVRRQTWPKPLRCLSLACAGGEEPYSLALTLAGAGCLPHQVVLDAVDISARNLAHTRQGRYSEFALRAVDASFRERHFRKTDTGDYQLHPEWLGWLRLHQGNIIDDAWQPPSSPYHIIFCRNVMIYFTAAMQRHLMRRLTQWLAPHGLLVVGHAEGSLTRQFFQPWGGAKTLGFGLRPVVQEPVSVLPAWTTLPLEVQWAPAPTQAADAPPAPPVVPAAALPASITPPPAPSLAEAQRLADRGAWATATTQSLAYLATLAPSALVQRAETYFLLGLIALAQQQYPEAEAYWRKVIYLVPEHALALRYLSVLERQGHIRTGNRWQARWQQVEPRA